MPAYADEQLYPVGILFGLGFDTASEVALLGLMPFLSVAEGEVSASVASKRPILQRGRGELRNLVDS